MTSTCDVCGLVDPYNGQGDGIGSCECPRCECGASLWSSLCVCPPEDDDPWGGANLAICGDPACRCSDEQSDRKEDS